MALTERNACKDCKARYAQEMGLCRQCQKRRIEDNRQADMVKPGVQALRAHDHPDLRRRS